MTKKSSNITDKNLSNLVVDLGIGEMGMCAIDLSEEKGCMMM